MSSPVGFTLNAPPVLSRSVVMRDEPIRTDRERQLAGWPKARLVVLDEGGRTPVEWGDVRRAPRPLGHDRRLRRAPAHAADHR